MVWHFVRHPVWSKLYISLHVKLYISLHVKLYTSLHVKHHSILTDFNETWNFSTDFRKILKYQISWKSVQEEASCAMRTDGQKDRHYEVNSQSLCTILRTCLKKVKPYVQFMFGRLCVTCNFLGLENKRTTVFNYRQLLKPKLETKQFIVKRYVYTYVCIYIFICPPHIYFH